MSLVNTVARDRKSLLGVGNAVQAGDGNRRPITSYRASEGIGCWAGIEVGQETREPCATNILRQSEGGCSTVTLQFNASAQIKDMF